MSSSRITRDGVRGSPRPRRQLSHATSAMLLMFPVLVALAVGKSWPGAEPDFYSTSSQIMATLFIAIAVDFFTPAGLVAQAVLPTRVVMGLMVMSWTGLFSCISALLDEGDGLSAGLAAGGLMASSILVSLTLLSRVRVATQASQAKEPLWVVLVFLLPPVALLILKALVR